MATVREWKRVDRAGADIGSVLGLLLVGELTGGEGEGTQRYLAELLRCCGWTCTPPVPEQESAPRERQNGTQ